MAEQQLDLFAHRGAAIVRGLSRSPHHTLLPAEIDDEIAAISGSTLAQGCKPLVIVFGNTIAPGPSGSPSAPADTEPMLHVQRPEFVTLPICGVGWSLAARAQARRPVMG
jgi:hypothetical protein